MSAQNDIVLVFDTSNEVVACGIGRVCAGAVELLAQKNVAAHRASNTRLLGVVQSLFDEVGCSQQCLSVVGVGIGPGSFTGVRIAVACAKGIASALGVPLVGLSTLESIAWGAWRTGVRGRVLVVADAMRKEVYPAYFQLDDTGVCRLTKDCVVKAASFVSDIPQTGVLIAGDALAKYSELFGRPELELSSEVWTPTGAGLLLALQAALGRPGALQLPRDVLPVYTRLSDAEESERVRLSQPGERNLVCGVQHAGISAVGSSADASADIRPFDALFAGDAAAVEQVVMHGDAWSEALFRDDLARAGRTWWMALVDGVFAGYAGALVCDGDAQILKVAVVPALQHQGIATALVARVLEDARNLAAHTCSLEVRISNQGARAFYEALGMQQAGVRPHYYSDGEDAAVYQGSIDAVLARVSAPSSRVVAGIGLKQHPSQARSCASESPCILALETSCDETAGAVIDGTGDLLADVVASQIDFHARFGGVVPEIASRKHIEAICGVAEAALQDAQLCWRDLDAVACTYAPGLVGALVVGVAFAKGAAWALGVPYIGVNHLEGHVYANKLACAAGEPFEPPAVVSLLSGGNTLLVYMRDWQQYTVLGGTIDDAVGEAFDKVAKALGLPYPGGPHISRLAETGNPQAIDFPRALLHSKDYRFSLSGLKTAVITYIQQAASAGTLNAADVCASFEQAVIDVQVAKAACALDETGAPVFCVGGGVAANAALRAAYQRMCDKKGVRLIVPPLHVCGDNAAMIALVALDRYRQGKFFGLDSDAYAHTNLEEPY